VVAASSTFMILVIIALHKGQFEIFPIAVYKYWKVIMRM
jgi:hypothetical protein